MASLLSVDEVLELLFDDDFTLSDERFIYQSFCMRQILLTISPVNSF